MFSLHHILHYARKLQTPHIARLCEWRRILMNASARKCGSQARLWYPSSIASPLHARVRTSLLITWISRETTLINLLLLLKSRPTPIADALTMRIAYIGYMIVCRIRVYPVVFLIHYLCNTRDLRAVTNGLWATEESSLRLSAAISASTSTPRSLIYDNYLVTYIFEGENRTFAVSVRASVFFFYYVPFFITRVNPQRFFSTISSRLLCRLHKSHTLLSHAIWSWRDIR